MYNYRPTGIYASKALADKEREERTQKFNDQNIYKPELNEIEINFVKFLFHIRNANYNGQRKQKNHTIKYNKFSGPSSYKKRERVFIAGKIFPILNIAYNGEDANATNISFKTLNFSELRLLFGEDDYSMYNISYISIDNDKIKIFLPKSYTGIDFLKILLDFLKNGKETLHTIGGEFPDYETYRLALRDKAQPLKSWIGEDGCWLKSDRADDEKRWWNGCAYILQYKVKGRLAPFSQIYDFYEFIDSWIESLGHEVKWCKGAKKLVKALKRSPIGAGGLEKGSNVVDNDVETILNELNLGICDFAIGKFHELIFGKYAKMPLKGENAYNWDVDFITREQGKIAPPIYAKTNPATIKKYQKMADHDGYDISYGASSLGMGSLLLNWVTPPFDSFTPKASVTDNQFRIDLPLLMLYLDKHKPKWYGFIGKLNSDGTVNDDVKNIIRKYIVN